jgi:phage gp46-like protein
MMIDQYQGDPKVFITNDGAEMVFIGGQPLMDAGLENTVLISLLTQPGWYGNAFARTPSERLGSIFESVGQDTFTLSTLATLQDIVEKSLQRLIDDKIISAINVRAKNPTGRVVEVQIASSAPDIEILLTRQGSNWIAQIQDPAHRKIDNNLPLPPT